MALAIEALALTAELLAETAAVEAVAESLGGVAFALRGAERFNWLLKKTEGIYIAPPPRDGVKTARTNLLAEVFYTGCRAYHLATKEKSRN